MIKNINKKRRNVVLSVLALLFLVIFGSSPLIAQSQSQSSEGIDVSDKELLTYAEVLMEIQQIQSEYGKEAQSAISESSLSEERFKEIYQAAQSGNQNAEGQTEAESKEFKEVIGKMQELQKDANEKMVSLVKENGFTVERFNNITQAYKQNPKLQERLKELL